MLELSRLGYSFVEGSCNLLFDLRKFEQIPLSSVQRRLVDSAGYSEMDDKDKERLFGEIRAGLFNTDRIFLDPHFTNGIAATRYVNWLNDAVVQGAMLYKIVYKGDSIGFFIIKSIGGGIYYPFLAGMYGGHQKSGLGLNAIYQPLSCVKSIGGKKVDTYVSTNNMSVLRMHTRLGFEIGHINNVFIKHNA
jgi:hypothetical protein